MNLKPFFLILLLSILGSTLNSQTRDYNERLNLNRPITETVNIVGFGVTEEFAIINALDKAIQEVIGTPVSTNIAEISNTTPELAAFLGSLNFTIDLPGVTGSFDGTRVPNNQLNRNSDYYNLRLIRALSNGSIKDFRIVSSEFQETGQVEDSNGFFSNLFANVPKQDSNRLNQGISGIWRVVLSIDVSTYVQGQEMPSIVVVPIDNTLIDASFTGLNNPIGNLGQTINNNLIASLTRSNRFNVISRQYDQLINAELSRVGRGNANLLSNTMLRQAIVADLLLNINNLRINYNLNSYQMRTVDRDVYYLDGIIEADINLLEVSTGRIILSEVLRLDIGPSERTSNRFNLTESQFDQYLRDFLLQSLDNFNLDVTNKVLLKSFPVSVIELNGQDVLLNQGNAILREGDVYDAVLILDEVLDPQTGQLLGLREEFCCQIQIESSNGQMSVGRLINDQITENFNFYPGSIELREKVEEPLISEPEEEIQMRDLTFELIQNSNIDDSESSDRSSDW